MCYHIKFGSSVTKGVHINRTESQKLWCGSTPPLVVGAWLTPRNTSLPTYYPAEFSHSSSNGMIVIKEIHLKNDPSHPILHGHSRSLEPTWIDLPPMTPIKVPQPQWIYLVQFPRSTAISVKVVNFYHLMLLMAKIINFSYCVFNECPR